MITNVPEKDWDGPNDPASNKIKDNAIRSYLKTGLSKKIAKKIAYKITNDQLLDDRPVEKGILKVIKKKIWEKYSKI